MSDNALLIDEKVLIELTDDERREIMKALSQEDKEQNRPVTIPNSYSLFEDISSMDYSEYHDYPNSDGVIDYLQDSEAVADFPDLVDLFAKEL